MGIPSHATDLCYLSALELIEGYRRRKFSPVEVTDAVLARIDRFNAAYTAFITVTADLARSQAVAAERAYGANGTPRPLEGVPISIKDLTPTKGIRTTRGSLIDPDWVPDYDPPFMERVYGAGAVMLGKTNTPEFGWKGDSGNKLVGPTHNPWRHGKTAGGSSGGAAAAVAAGMGPLAQGSDGGGSIRIPASFCGIFGLKASANLVPQYPPSAFGDLSHLGPMTRTVRDAALLMNVTAGADARDRLSWSSGLDHLAACDGGIKGLRAAWAPALGGAMVDPVVAAATAKAAHRFTELGCVVEEVAPQFDDPLDIWAKLWASATAAFHADDLNRVRDKIELGRLGLVEWGQKLTGVEVARLTIRRNGYYQQVRQFMERYDLLLTPTLARTAFTAGADGPSDIAGQPLKTPMDWAPFAAPFNLTGQPAATVPCGFDSDGLPIGLQIVGRWHADATVLRAAAAFEEMAPWAQLRPPMDS